MTDDTLRRFYGALVEALRERGPADLERPFTVAEIYQDLVPYRTHRDALGVEMNGDYEHALLRLLAGEGGYLRIESELAQREIRQELDEVDPNTALYRDFAAVDVRLEPDAIPEFDDDLPGGAKDAETADALAPEGTRFSPSFASGTSASEAGAGSGADAAEAASEPGPADAEAQAEAGIGAPAPDVEISDGADLPEPGRSVATSPSPWMPEDGICRWCTSELPERENLRYCPFCGVDQTLSPCGACGEAIEPGWKYCIVCGASA
jgi:hypothetical protein